MRNKFGLIIVLLLIIIFSVVSFRWIKHRIEYAVTDAVFVETEKLAHISFKRVSGKIVKMYREEGDTVKKGEILAEIDPSDYQIQLEKLKAEIKSLSYKKEALEKKLERIKSQLNRKLEISKLSLRQVEEEIKGLTLKLKQIDFRTEQLEKDVNRFRNLAKKDLVPARKLEEMETELKILRTEREALSSRLEQMRINKVIMEKKVKQAKADILKTGELKKEISSIKEKINVLKKQKEDIQNLIKETKLVAPFDGKIAKKYKTEGEVVSSGMPVYAVVSDEEIYINVLLEETKLKGIRKGSKAYIRIDAYPDEVYEGVVEEINPVAAAKFALVPRDVTAGEFTKVAQRIPVKIRITKGNTSLLRVGMSGEVEIKRDR
ncbi:HlyD family secretion protein [Persephonella sp.]